MNDNRDIGTDSTFFHGSVPPFFTMLIFGIALLLITPPFQAPDEPAHFYRSWQIGCFKRLIIEPDQDAGTYMFEDLHTLKLLGTDDFPFHSERKVSATYFKSLFDFRFQSEKEEWILFSNTATNHWYLYIPQVTGVIFSRMLDTPPIYSLYFGRILNLLTWSFCVMASIRLFPPLKWLFLSLALMPMTLFQASSLSADALVFGTAFCFIAVVMRMITREGSITWIETTAIMVIGSLFMIGKQGYFPLAGLVLLIPRRRFKTRLHQTRFMLVCLLLFSAVVVLRIHMISGIQDHHPKVVPDDQLANILSDPVGYIWILINSLNHKLTFYLISFVGFFGWLDTPLPDSVVFFYLIFILVICNTTVKIKPALTFGQKLVMTGITIGNVLILMTLMYLYWTPVGDRIIEGVQGRYLIPIAPITGLLFSNRSVRNITRNRFFAPVFYLVIWGMLSYSVLVIVARYYIGV